VSEPSIQPLRRFECSIPNAPWGEDHWATVHAFTRGQAKSEYWRDIRECWPNIPFTAVRCRGPFTPCDTDKFRHTADYRKVNFHIGDPVTWRGKVGRIVDSNSSANFEVLFPCGDRIHIHPIDIEQGAVTLGTNS
jgi:hypothetical protein